jgi:DNA-binding CsgD family transcriptional regulator
MRQVPTRQKIYEAVVSLSDARGFEEMYRRILVQACSVMEGNEGFLFVKQGQQNSNVQLEYNDGCFKMQACAAGQQFPSFTWGSPLYAPSDTLLGFLGVSGNAVPMARIGAHGLHAFSRYAVVASWALYYAAGSESCYISEGTTSAPVLHDCFFYIKQILHYNADAAKASALFAEYGKPSFHYQGKDGSAIDLDVRLTEREIEVLSCLQAGGSNQAIAAKMHFSIATVKYHLSHIFKKLKVKNRMQAVMAAHQQGII